MKKKQINWLGWTRYFVGRGLEIFGLVIVTWSMFMFIGSPEMRTMLAMAGAGAAFFGVGWLLAKKNPEASGK